MTATLSQTAPPLMPVPPDRAPDKQTGGFWPNPTQQLLLRAALLDGADGRRAWQEWQEIADIEVLDTGSFRLLPLLYSNLLRLGVDDPVLPRLKGVYRHFWFRNQLLFHHMAKLMATFQQAEIPTLVLKGAPYSVLYYQDPAARPMGDFDLLIRPQDRDRALAILQAEHWQPIYYESFAGLTPGYLSYSTSHGFRDPDRRELDLHWHLFSFCAAAECDRGFWERSVPLAFGAVATRTLSAGDHLLHACVHGAAWDEIPPIRWVADALLILRSAAAEIDWLTLLGEARHHQVTVPLRETCHYLRQRFDAPIPEAFLAGLRELPVIAAEEREFRARTQPLSARGPLLELWLLHRQASRWRRRAGVSCPPFTYLRTMQYTAKRATLAELPLYAARRGGERLAAGWHIRFKPKEKI